MAVKKKITGAGYVKEHAHWSKGLTTLRNLLLDTELEEHIKWGIPVFCIDGKNVVGVAGFKHKYGLWFYQGSFMSDPAGIMVNAQEGKTKGMRHIYFEEGDKIDKKVIKCYIKEAIDNQKAGKTIKSSRRSLILDPILEEALEDKELNVAFEKLRMSQRIDFAEHILRAKQEATKLRRLDKIVPMIMEGVGLHDKYKK